MLSRTSLITWAVSAIVCWVAVFLARTISGQESCHANMCLARKHQQKDYSGFSSIWASIQAKMGQKPRFRVVQKFRPSYSPNDITQYESERTGMRVVVVDQEGPKLNGYFVLATEIHDDSGAPHTLEHLCFMGSKSYKYKGFLDKLATRAYAGTNAWTATDHTAYTLETAGWAGFAQILPVYLEHVILPTLTDAGCMTEVHHIDGTGNDAGVVYSEMQGVQNTASELMELRSKRLLYPEGVGFRYETGGMLEQLRVLTAQRIRDFHREMYQPKNLCVALFGEVDHADMLQILDKFETSILGDIPSPDKPFRRPWIDSEQTPSLSKTTIERVEFPEEDESMGQVDIRFLGPNSNDILLESALNVVLAYLAGSSAALLDSTIVEKEQLASGIYYQIDSRPRIEIAFSLSGIETDRLEQVHDRFFEVLREAMDKDLDMDFIHDIIHRQVRIYKYNSESSSTAFADPVIADYLFGDRSGATLQKLANLEHYTDTLANWKEEQWRKFIKEYISHAHHVSVLGVPSQRLSEKLKADEIARVEEQKKRLGLEGLKQKAEELEKAKAENDREIPEDVLGEFKVPPTESIHFVTTSSARTAPALKIGKPNNRYQKVIDADQGQEMPLFVDFEHIPSNFARISLIISTETVPLELRPLISVYFEAFFTLPIKRGEEIIDFERVVIELERDTCGYGISDAGQLGNAECLRITFQVEIEKYTVAIKWLKELMWDSIFDETRLEAVNARLLADVPDSKRDGSDMLTAIYHMTHLAPQSINRSRSTLVKALYLKAIKKLLKTSPSTVINQFELLRSHLCQFPNFRVLVISDLSKLSHPVSSWTPFLASLDTSAPLAPLGDRLSRLSPAGQNPGSLSYIVPLATIDSSFLLSCARGPKSHTDPVLPALMVAMSYFNAVEGPLWTAVRGTGLAYGTSMSYEIDSGSINLEVYRSPNAWAAFEASSRVVRAHIDGSIPFDKLMLEGAISSIVVGFANEQTTMASAAGSSFVKSIMRGLEEDYNTEMLKKVRQVGVEEVKKVLSELVWGMFEPERADVFVTCAVGLKEAISDGLKSVGFKPEIRDLTSFQDDYGLKVDDGGEDGDDDDEEDEEELEGSEGYEMVEEGVDDDEDGDEEMS